MDIWNEHCRFVKKYDKLYNKYMFMGQNFTKNPFMTSNKSYVKQNLICI